MRIKWRLLHVGRRIFAAKQGDLGLGASVHSETPDQHLETGFCEEE